MCEGMHQQKSGLPISLSALYWCENIIAHFRATDLMCRWVILSKEKMVKLNIVERQKKVKVSLRFLVRSRCRIHDQSCVLPVSSEVKSRPHDVQV